MPKMSERERLADLEAKQRKLAGEIDTARIALRGRYAAIAREMALEAFSEREFREAMNLLVRLGPGSALQLLRQGSQSAPARIAARSP